MAFSCGFYNSIDHDRVYDAVQFGEMFDGLITDGVYETVGNRMMVKPVSGMTVRVQSGRAWFNKTWSVNTSDYPLEIPMSDILLPRIDAVILEIDTRLQTRNNSLKVISGRSASNPTKPTLTRSNGLYQYPLAWVTVAANARSITTADIEIQVGRTPTPFVTGVVNGTDISTLWDQWKSQFQRDLNKWDTEFQTWFDEVRDTLTGAGGGDNLTALTSRITALESFKNNKASIRDISNGTSETSNKWINPYDFKFWWKGSRINDSSGLGEYDGARAEINEVNDGTELYKYVSPLTLANWYKEKRWRGSLNSLSSDDLVTSRNLYDLITNTSGSGGKIATKENILSGENLNIITPLYLKEAFPGLYDGNIGDGGDAIEVSQDGTVRGHSGVNVTKSKFKVIKSQTMTDLNNIFKAFIIGITFTVTSSAQYVGFSISNIPKVSSTYDTTYHLTIAVGSDYGNVRLGRLLMTHDVSDGINCILESLSTGTANPFKTGDTYSFDVTGFYW